MLAKGKVANFTGGISQQADALRLPTQSASEINTYPVIVDGNRRRPPSEFVAALPASDATAYSHFITRDTSERYVMAISGGAISVTGLDGSAKTVNYPQGSDYLTTPGGTTDAANFNAVTVADYTFITNKSVAVAMSTTDLQPAQPVCALINVLQGNYGREYSIDIDGVRRATYLTPPGTNAIQEKFTDPTYIISILVAMMTGNNFPDELGLDSSTFTPGTSYSVGVDPKDATSSGGCDGSGDIKGANGWSVQVYGNAIYIVRLTGVPFSIEVRDGYNGNAMKVIKDSTQFFTDLPRFAPHGYVASVTGDQGNHAQVYYVQFKKTNVQDGSGVWVECPQPGMALGFDAATMPHILVRNPNGTFAFKQATWNKRTCGDLVTSPDPSMVGNTVEDILFYQNRLGFFAGDNILLSRAGDFFNFFRTTATALQDDDPIDVNSSTQVVSLFHAAVPYQQSLILWSDQTQFSFSGNDLLTPRTVNMNVVTSYDNLSKVAKPISTPRRIFFAVDRNGYSGIREWYYDVFYRIGQADDDTAHVPSLIPSGAFKMVNSTVEDVFCVASTGEPSSVWVYKYAWQGSDKIQSAWTQWYFYGATVLNMEVIDSQLYLILNRYGGTFLEKVRLSPGLTDSGAPLTYLDRRIGSEACSGTYHAESGTTTYALPYAPDPTLFKAVCRANSAAPQYQAPAVVSVAGSTVTLQGNTTSMLLWFGETFTTRYTFSPIFARDASNNALQEGRLQLLKMDLMYEQTGYFRVVVAPAGRGTCIYEYNPWEGGAWLPNDQNPSAVRNGTFTFPIMTRSDNVSIQVVNDSFYPSALIRAEWKGNFVPKARK